jgi:opacity protein-like surface antigen
MYLRTFLLIALVIGVNFAEAQDNSGRLSVAAANTTPSSSPVAPRNTAPQASASTTTANSSSPVPTSTSTPFVSNVTDAPLPDIANQPKVITPTQSSGPEGPKGPRDGRWYASIGGGAMVEQFQVNATSTAVGQQPLDQGPSGNLGSYAEFKVGYDFAVRDVQLAFGGPTPMRTSMELEGSYLGTYENIPLYNVSTGGPTVGHETYNLNAYNLILNGLVKFEELPVTPYFGGGVGVVFMTALNHKMTVDGSINGTPTTYSTSVSTGNNTSLALQAIVGLEREIYDNLTLFVEYKFLAWLDVKFAYGSEPTTSAPPVQGGSNSQNDFTAQQLLSAGVKYSF